MSSSKKRNQVPDCGNRIKGFEKLLENIDEN